MKMKMKMKMKLIRSNVCEKLCFSFPVCEKPKYDSEANSDRLTELPDHLIVEILSLLPTEEAVRTEVLSTRWKNLWKNMDKIVLNREYSSLFPEMERKFISSVDHTLMQCVSLKTLSLCTYIYCEDNFDFLHGLLDKWLQRVYSQKVENLKVDISCRFSSYVPYEQFYHNPNLVKLDISYWNFTVPVPIVSWSSLRSLSLQGMIIGDEQFSKMLSGCPVLEDLDLYDVRFNSLNIMSPHMVKLSVTYIYLELEDGFIDINAPWLQSLHLVGWFEHHVVRLLNVSSLVHANLSFDNHDNVRLDVATNVLKSVNHVQELTIGNYFIPALSLLKLSGIPCQLFSKCKRLTFILPICKHEIPGITYVLKNAPHLETLAIEVRPYPEDEIHYDINEICDFEEAMYLSMESGDFPNLKSIEVTYCYCNGDPCSKQKFFIFEFVACILQKAPLLEKLVIAQHEESCKCLIDCARDGASMLSVKLLKFFMDGGGARELKTMRKYKSAFEVTFK